MCLMEFLPDNFCDFPFDFLRTNPHILSPYVNWSTLKGQNWQTLSTLKGSTSF